ncbi:MAG TPA: type II methionyl aminopeptidase [Euryarchaeota archaeon]|nr:methionine aminopeptidase [archaeon BMS3Bbin15]HDL15879.1 type II methionyl aminopeptidase [Euryarchaeota archaeon]
MEEEAYDSYIRAGNIGKQVMQEGLEKIREGEKLLNVADYIENKINELGGKPAFPVNISIDDIAAHYSPTAWDESVFSEGDMVKLDIGVHINGYIADMAKTKVIDSSEDNEVIMAAEEALKSAIDIIKPGVKTNEIGDVVETAIKEFNLKPIENLTGHKLDRFSLHGGITIPNIKTRHGDTIYEGDVFAIEPFSTSGFGKVVEKQEAIIFKYVKDKPMRMRESRILLKHVKKNFFSLPFAERWVAKLMPRHRLYIALRQLSYAGALYAYRILREKERAKVAQAEHTVIVTGEGCEVITK